MTNKYYECHITFNDNPEKVKEVVEAAGWSFSCIAGDIVLGEGVKCYATKHFNSEKYSDTNVIIIVCGFAVECRGHRLNVLREKVELVIFDTKSSKIRPD